LEPLTVEFQVPSDDLRIVGRDDGQDLVERHPLETQRRGDPQGRELHPDRSFGVSINPSPAANSGIPSGIPMTVKISSPPVMNRTEPSTIPLRLGNSGPTHPLVVVSSDGFDIISSFRTPTDETEVPGLL
jgi:hypothetical protein